MWKDEKKSESENLELKIWAEAKSGVQIIFCDIMRIESKTTPDSLRSSIFHLYNCSNVQHSLTGRFLFVFSLCISDLQAQIRHKNLVAIFN